jgi:hypothetical protein
MCGVWRGYDVAGVGGGEFALRLVLRQRVAPLYWRSDTHTHNLFSNPSTNPSSILSRDPTSNLSSIPSTNPSSVPSRDPSSYPSSVPSTNPSSVSSRDPSGDPSSIPSSIPSRDPSSIPSLDPSSNPSQGPSKICSGGSCAAGYNCPDDCTCILGATSCKL